MNDTKRNEILKEDDFRILTMGINQQFKLLIGYLELYKLGEAGMYVDLGYRAFVKNVANTLEKRYRKS